MGPFKKGLDYGVTESRHIDKINIEDSAVIRDWKKLADSVDEPDSECVIAVVGKYIDQG